MKNTKTGFWIGTAVGLLLLAGVTQTAWAQNSPPLPPPEQATGANPPDSAVAPPSDQPLPPPPGWRGAGMGRGARGCPPGCPGFADADQDGRCDNFTDGDGDGWCDNRPAGPAPGFRSRGRTPNGPPPAWHGTGMGRGAWGCPRGCPGFADADQDGRCDNFTDGNGDGWCDNCPAGPAPGFRGRGRTPNGPPPAWHGTGMGRGAWGCPRGCPGFADADQDGRCDNFTDGDGDGWCDNRPAGPAPGFRGRGRTQNSPPSAAPQEQNR